MKKVVINRSGKNLNITEVRQILPFDGKTYLLDEVLVNKYRNFIEVIDYESIEKSKKYDFVIKEKENLNLIMEHFIQNVKVKKIDLLYSFHFDKKDIDEAIQRLKCSINSIINQNIRICLCNTSKICIKDEISEFVNDISYLHLPLNLDIYCKPKIINIGVNELIRSEYFLLSDIDLFYHNDFIKGISLFLISKPKIPIRLVFYNSNLGKNIPFPKNIKECEYFFKTNPDKERIPKGTAPGNGLVHLPSFKKVNGFEERYLGYGLEDVDFNFRISKINKYLEIDWKYINTYHFYHKNKNSDEHRIILRNNIRMYNHFIDKYKTNNIIEANKIQLPKNFLHHVEDNLEEIVI